MKAELNPFNGSELNELSHFKQSKVPKSSIRITLSDFPDGSQFNVLNTEAFIPFI